MNLVKWWSVNKFAMSLTLVSACYIASITFDACSLQAACHIVVGQFCFMLRQIIDKMFAGVQKTVHTFEARSCPFV